MKWIKDEDWQGLMDFLPCATPAAWVVWAREHEETLLLNHCYLEQCAARTAMTLMFRCPDRPELLAKMSKLAREELHHFDQVHRILVERGYRYRILRPSRYAGRLNGAVRKEQPGQLIDTLIVGAYIEARSCERFAALVPHHQCAGDGIFRDVWHDGQPERLRPPDLLCYQHVGRAAVRLARRHDR